MFKRVLAATTFLLGASVAQADTRVALVIGNGAYRYVDALTNPRLDARAMKAALERLGFKVVYGEDLDQKRLGQKIAEFAGKAQDADVALTYYAGHGSTFGDTSYLVPVDAEFKSLEAITYELVPLEQMLGELRRAKGIRIAIIDACRDNAKERELKRVAQRGGAVSRGLARVQSPNGLILAFSTQYGMTAADGAPNTNSPFTAALVRQLATPGLDVRDVFFNAGHDVLVSTNGTQRPAIEVSLYDHYALLAAPPARVQSSASPTPEPVKPVTQLAALPPVVPAPVKTLPAATDPRRQALIAVCDRLAGMQEDSDLPAGTSVAEKLNASAAIPACRAAVEAAQGKPTATSWFARPSTTGAEQVAVEERRMRFQLGRALEGREQYAEAKIQYEQAGDLGSAAAMSMLGTMYDQGKGMARDLVAARSWYVKAADKGDAMAMYGLGSLYDQGRGVAQDRAAAHNWFLKTASLWKKAADQGDATAMYNLGSLYQEGLGVAQDITVARSLYERAAARGESSAMSNLGYMYDKGLGVAQDYKTARSWYEKAMAAGDDGASGELVKISAKILAQEQSAAQTDPKSPIKR